jgi:hypothetical protein
MKRLILLVMFLLFTVSAFAGIDWVNGYYRRNRTYVDGYYRDTSNDGNPYNNANHLGYNRHNRPEGIYGY